MIKISFCDVHVDHNTVLHLVYKMDNLNSEVLKFPVQESCGDEEEKDSRTRECKEKKRLQGNGSHSKELSLRSKLANPTFVPQSLAHGNSYS